MAQQIIVMDAEDAAKADHKCYLLTLLSVLKNINAHVTEAFILGHQGYSIKASNKAKRAKEELSALITKIENDSK